MKTLLGLFTLVITLMAATASATVIHSAHFNSSTQTLHLEISYEGGLKPHHFRLDWDSCQNISEHKEIAARLIDSGWDDTGSNEIFQSLTFDLTNISCKPALLTVRSGRVSHVSLQIE